MKRFSIISLGCPKNLVDSEKIADIMYKQGYILENKEKLDTVIINTCAFIKDAQKESDSVIKEQLKLKDNKKVRRVVVAGCLVSRYLTNIRELYPQVDLFIDTSPNKSTFYRDGIVSLDLFDYHSRFLLTRKHLAYLKISEGCDNRCSYCAIPSIKGRFRSRRMKDIIDEVKALSDVGVKELVIISQDTLRYGMDLYGKTKLLSLLERIEAINGIKWIRLMYLYPSLISSEIVRFIKNSKKVLHYFDIPLQHVSDKILKLMNRKYDYKRIRMIFDMIYKEIDDACIRANFIVGFPYEDDNDFKKLKDFINHYPLTYINIFKYSREEGTPSYNLSPLPTKVVNERYKKLITLASKKIDEFNKKIEGKVFTIIADSKRRGRSYMDAPEIDGYFETDKDVKEGCFYKVCVKKAYGLRRRCVLV